MYSANIALCVSGIIILLVVLYGTVFELKHDSIKNRVFIHLALVTLVSLIFNLFTVILSADPATERLSTIFLVAGFVCAFLWCILLAFFRQSFMVDMGENNWRPAWIMVAVIIANGILDVAFAMSGLMFHFEDGFVIFDELADIPGLLNLVIFIAFIVSCFVKKKVIGLHNCIALTLYILIPIIAIGFMMFFPGLVSVYFGMSLSVLICYAMVCHEELVEKSKKLQEINDELALAIEQARNASNAKTIFLNNMSHDIRTPMNAIIGFTQLMEGQVNNPEAIADYLSKIQIAGDYLLTIINNILDIARIDSGKTQINKAFTDLYDKDSNVLDFFESEIKKKNLHFSANMDLTHRYVFMDMIKCRQIMVNLVSNAIKYTPDGGSVKVELIEEPCDREGYANFITKVSDTGIGISKEFQKEIFDSFTREHNSTESKILGTGLGMSIVKRLVDLMEGTITVESELGKGSVFTVTFTHKLVENPEEYLKQLSHKGDGVKRNIVKRILVAEDNDLNAEITMTLLENSGFLTERAIDGLECVDLIVSSEPGYYDLILMDIQMPNMDGYTATRTIRSLKDESKSTIPIYAVTANAFDVDKQNASDAGMNGHIAKPIRLDEILKTINKL